MEDQKRKPIIIVLAVILVLAVVGVLTLFFLNNKKIVPIPMNNQPKSGIEPSYFNGELYAINGERIEIFQYKNLFDEKTGIESSGFEIVYFNVSLEDPVTLVTNDLNKTEAKLSDLKVGQVVMVEYEEETRNAINIYYID